MAERRPPAYRVQLEYRFDRLQPDKLRQAYQLLVPARRGEVQNHLPEVKHETGCDLRPRVLSERGSLNGSAAIANSSRNRRIESVGEQ